MDDHAPPPAGAMPPASLDVFEFARRGDALSGRAALGDFERLAGSLEGIGGPLDWKAQGELGPDPEGRPARWLRLGLRFDAPLQCVRCLETVTLPVDMERRFKLEQSQEAVEAEPLDEDRYDTILGSPRFDLAGLVEDEALLALPFSPAHEDCGLPDGAGRSEDAEAREALPGRPNPFAALAALKKTRDGDR